MRFDHTPARARRAANEEAIAASIAQFPLRRFSPVPETKHRVPEGKLKKLEAFAEYRRSWRHVSNCSDRIKPHCRWCEHAWGVITEYEEAAA